MNESGSSIYQGPSFLLSSSKFNSNKASYEKCCTRLAERWENRFPWRYRCRQLSRLIMRWCICGCGIYLMEESVVLPHVQQDFLLWHDRLKCLPAKQLLHSFASCTTAWRWSTDISFIGRYCGQMHYRLGSCWYPWCAMVIWEGHATTLTNWVPIEHVAGVFNHFFQSYVYDVSSCVTHLLWNILFVLFMCVTFLKNGLLYSMWITMLFSTLFYRGLSRAWLFNHFD